MDEILQLKEEIAILESFFFFFFLRLKLKFSKINAWFILFPASHLIHVVVCLSKFLYFIVY